MAVSDPPDSSGPKPRAKPVPRRGRGAALVKTGTGEDAGTAMTDDPEIRAPASARRGGVASLSELLDVALGDAAAKQGFARSSLLLAWPDLVGAHLADHAAPMKLEWPRRMPGIDEGPPPPATLLVRVESAFALELQHVAPVLVERINAHLGWRCIGRIALRQGPVPMRRRARSAPPAPDAEAAARVAEAVADIADEPLRASLEKLGRAVAAEAKRRV